MQDGSDLLSTRPGCAACQQTSPAAGEGGCAWLWGTTLQTQTKPTDTSTPAAPTMNTPRPPYLPRQTTQRTACSLHRLRVKGALGCPRNHWIAGCDPAAMSALNLHISVPSRVAVGGFQHVMRLSSTLWCRVRFASLGHTASSDDTSND